MPVMTIERLRQRESKLKQLLAEKRASLDPDRRRAAGRRLRRAQRRRRRLVARAARAVGKAPADGTETPSAG